MVLQKNIAAKMLENHSARMGGLARASMCRCSDGMALKKARPGRMSGCRILGLLDH